MKNLSSKGVQLLYLSLPGMTRPPLNVANTSYVPTRMEHFNILGRSRECASQVCDPGARVAHGWKCCDCC